MKSLIVSTAASNLLVNDVIILISKVTNDNISIISHYIRVPRTRMSAVCLCLQTCLHFYIFLVSVSASEK